MPVSERNSSNSNASHPADNQDRTSTTSDMEAAGNRGITNNNDDYGGSSNVTDGQLPSVSVNDVTSGGRNVDLSPLYDKSKEGHNDATN